MENKKKIDIFAPSKICKVSEAIENLRDIGLSDKMIIALIHDKTRIAKRTIKEIIDAILNIEESIRKKFNITKNWSDWAKEI